MARLTGDSATRLVFLRGNSGAGKTTIARLIQQRLRPTLAVISQDVVRRDILRTAPGPDIALLDTIARHCLDASLDVVIEGHLSAETYGDMLQRLKDDHAGRTTAFVMDVSFDETVRRHATKSLLEPFGIEEMRTWWQGECPVISGLDEHVINQQQSAEQAAHTIMQSADLQKRDRTSR